MSRISWIHTSDLHLGKPIIGLPFRDLLAIRIEEFYTTFEKITIIAKEKGVDFLIIAGDFLEHGYLSNSKLDFIADALKNIHPTKVLIAPGNHDPYRSDSAYCTYKWPANVHIFGPSWQSLVFRDLDLEIVGKGFRDFIEVDWVAPIVKSGHKNKILIVHGSLADAKSPYNPIKEGDCKPFQYIAAGHIHKFGHYKLNGGGTIFCYPGSPEGLNWKETGERVVVYGTLSPENGVEIETIPVEQRQYKRFEIDISRCEDGFDLRESIGSAIKGCSYEDFIKVDLIGTREQFASLELDDEFSNYHMEINDHTQTPYDLEYLRSQPGIVGHFIKKMEEDMIKSPQKERELLDILYLGLDFLVK